MGIGILIVSHEGVGTAILGAATRIYGNCPLETRVITVAQDADPEPLYAQGIAYGQEIDSGEGI